MHQRAHVAYKLPGPESPSFRKTKFSSQKKTNCVREPMFFYISGRGFRDSYWIIAGEFDFHQCIVGNPWMIIEGYIISQAHSILCDAINNRFLTKALRLWHAPVTISAFAYRMKPVLRTQILNPWKPVLEADVNKNMGSLSQLLFSEI